jgi:acyl carrier protein
LVKDQIRKFIGEHFPAGRLQPIEDQTNLLETCLVDSLGILEVVLFLEREFHLALEDEELVPENFQTLSALAAFVERKLAQ